MMSYGYLKGLLITFLLILLSFTAFADAKVEVKSPMLPILINRPVNMVLEIWIEGPACLDEIVLNSKGTTCTEHIESVSVYYTGRASLKKIVKTDQGAIFAKAENISGKTILNGSMEVGPGKHCFAVSYSLSSDTDLLEKFQVHCESVTVSGVKNNVSSSGISLKPAVSVRDCGDDGCLGYRIPSLVTTNNGTLLATYDIRWDSRRDLQGDMDIGLSRSVDGGKTWQPMQRIIDIGCYGNLPQKFNGVSDAGLLVDKNSGDIFCFGLWMHGIRDKECQFKENLKEDSKDWQHQWKGTGSCPGMTPRETCQFMMVKSSDDGKTWSEPRNMTSEIKDPDWILLAPSPGCGITLADGTIVASVQGRKDNYGFSTVIYSKDHGDTWSIGKSLEPDLGESGIAQLADGAIMMNGRTPREYVYRAVITTSDLGNSWERHPTDMKALVEPSCMGSFIKYDYKVDGNDVLLFSCPDSQQRRECMTIYASLDQGNTWSENNRIMIDSYGGAYSCLTTVKEGVIGIFYESSQADLIFQQVSIDDIVD